MKKKRPTSTSFLLVVPALVLNGWRLFFAQFEKTLLAAILLIFLLPSSSGNAQPNGLPIDSDLDDDAPKWGVYTEGNPTWDLTSVSIPSLDGRSLRCAITGGIPYSNVHCYRNLPAQPNSNTFTVNMSFYYRPPSTFNNVGGTSIVQALEFTMNKWHQGKRYEWALQWKNVDGEGETGAPEWRYWGRVNPGDKLDWIDLGVSGSLAGNEWHTLKLEGDIFAGQVRYQRFIIDGQSHPINITEAPASEVGEPDRLAVAVQLDGNGLNPLSPYELFVDRVTFTPATAANVNINIGGASQGTHNVLPQSSMKVSYASLNNGPVKVISTNGVPIVVSERVAYSPNGGTTWTSYSELMGLPSNQLTTSYTFPWYNNVDLNSQLRFGNVGSTNTNVTVTVGGVVKGTYNLAPNASQRVSYVGLDKGPVKVTSSGGVPIIASLRVAYFNGSKWTSFSEMMGLPSTKLTNSYIFPWYNNIDLNSQLRFGNVGTANTTVTVTVGGVFKGAYNLAPNASQRVSYPALDGGPVKVTSSGNVPIIASLRVAYNNGSTWTDFSEIMGLPISSLSTRYSFPIYNNVNLNTQLRFGNAGNASTTVTVSIGGVFKGSYMLAPNESKRVSYAGVDSGPVVIASTGGVPIIASERVAYFNGSAWTSFAEMMGLPFAQWTDTYVFPWYNNIDLNTQLRFGVP